MKEYELVREIMNSCSGNQMRDVFFSEIETDNPVKYVEDMLNDPNAEITTEELDGGLKVHVNTSGLFQHFTFTEI